jgi:hypothetical protein
MAGSVHPVTDVETKPTEHPAHGHGPDEHQWWSYTEDDGSRTWMFDLTFLTSAWTCIYGDGCTGVLTAPAPELEQGCCSYGAHLTGDDDKAKVEAKVTLLGKDEWQLRERTLAQGEPFTKGDDGWVTAQVDDACCFLNRPGHPGGAGCAFHPAAVNRGESYVDWKPDVCWQLPFRLEEHLDDNDHLWATLREWKRRDWGDGGFEFDWWCTEGPEAFVGHEPVYLACRDEIVGLVGEGPYRRLVEHLEPGTPVLLAHPATVRD